MNSRLYLKSVRGCILTQLILEWASLNTTFQIMQVPVLTAVVYLLLILYSNFILYCMSYRDWFIARYEPRRCVTNLYHGLYVIAMPSLVPRPSKKGLGTRLSYAMKTLLEDNLKTISKLSFRPTNLGTYY